MTLTYGFYNSSSGDRTYDAIQISRLFDGIILDGVYAALGDKLMVAENTGMNVAVGTGRAWFDHTWSYNDADVIIAVPTADALLPRIDVVYLEVNEDTGTRANKLDILEGTPASSPVAPTLTNTATIHQYPLAHIEVGAAVTSITQANIINKVGLTETPFVTCPLDYVTTNELLAEWEAEWEEWFDAIKDQLSTEAETNLQNQIWEIVGHINPPPYETTLLELDTHDHSDVGDQVPTAGLENAAVTEVKIASGAVTENKIGTGAVTNGKLGASAVTAAKIATSVFGNGLGGGAGTAGFVRVDDDTIEINNDILRVKAGSIGINELGVFNRRMFLSCAEMQNISMAGNEETWGYSFLAAPTGTDVIAGLILIPSDYEQISGDISSRLLWSNPLSSGNVRWRLSYAPLQAYDDLDTKSLTNNDITVSGNGQGILTESHFGTLSGTFYSNNWITFKISRLGDHAEDTMTSNAKLLGILFDYDAWH